MDMETFLDDRGPMSGWHWYHYIKREGIKKEEVMKLYDIWAELFDEDVVRAKALPEIVQKERAPILTRLSTNKKNAKILDICAGTGLLGLELKEAGFVNIDALDGSRNMLAAAEKKGIYQKLILHWIDGERIPVDDNTYDGLVGAYCLIPGHIEDGTCFPELARMVRSGGKIAFIANINQLNRYEAALEQMAQAGIWKYEVSRASFSVSGLSEGDNEADIIEFTIN